MTADFWIAVSNQLPELIMTLRDGNGVVIDLSNPAPSSITLTMRQEGYPEPILAGAAMAIVTPPGSNGQVKYSWDADDTLRRGLYLARARVTYSGGKTIDFPNDGHARVAIS